MADRIIDDAEPVVVASRWRRGGLYAGLVVAVLLFAYWLSPYVAVTRFALAANAGSSEAVIERMDIPSLRNAFARQIIRIYLARDPRAQALDPLSRQAVGSLAGSFVLAIVSDYLTPQALADLMGRRRSANRADELLGERLALPRIDGLGPAWRLFLASGFTGPASFRVDPPAELAGEEGYRLSFGLRRGTWMLRAVELPRPALDRLADELAARMGRQQ